MAIEGIPPNSFEATEEILRENLDQYTAATIDSLQSYYLVMPPECVNESETLCVHGQAAFTS